MSIKVAVIQFPGSNCDLDTLHVLNEVMNIEAELIWHNEFVGSKFDAAILPGGFSFGDYLRSGIIAAHSPAIEEAKKMLKDDKPILGICNGFQILTEAQLLPGALLKNDSLKFICKWVHIRVENTHTAFTNQMKEGQVLDIPVAHGEGRYFTDKLTELKENKQIIFRYSDPQGSVGDASNPNGSLDNIAGVCDLERKCLGLMPHPERASEMILSPNKTTHGIKFFQSMIHFITSGEI
ncbi:MAG: Phosphoribosylformylglycinamidine synthase subunit PurQ [Promethearchaeota archaeon]|jgi:phosphoribosylformylglycinamidine synthase|nr:MAG: Phosphoribosylformylglycinamidine synthase subunit PurQ [Candidatus Lokiarchaeota archaeon]